MIEPDFRKEYEGTFPPLIDDVYRAHNVLAEKMYHSRDGKITGCTSYISRKMECGYNHAAAIMELMEEKGGITAADDRGARRLLPLPRS